ncbi:MAG: hypothetical protein K0S65_4306, partial [Labilithrix sp.]|nr:hypothetical protein [Labilithrix sp.]
MRGGLSSVFLVFLLGCGTDGAGTPSSSAPPTTKSSPPVGGDPGAGGPLADASAPPASCARSLVSKAAPASLFDAFVAEVGALDGPARMARVEAFLADVAAQGGAPLEDAASGRVVFLARGAPSGTFRASGSFSDWSPQGGVALAPVAGTDLWAGETTVAQSFEYKLVE